MPRPVGSQNLVIPDPPFVLEFGSGLTVVLNPKQTKPKTKGEEPTWLFDVQCEINDVSYEAGTMSLEELQDLEVAARLSIRWTVKMEREKEKLESQLEDLKKKLSFLQR